MNLTEVADLLNEKIEKFQARENEEMVELLNSFKEKLTIMSDEAFAQCDNFGDVRSTIEAYSPKKPRTSKATKTTYYKLDVPVNQATEKAIGIVVGDNGKHGSNWKKYIEWIPTSQTIEENETVYIPDWIISKSNLWNVVDKENKITK